MLRITRSGSDSSAPYGLGLGAGIPAARSASRAAAFDIWGDGVSSYYVNDSLGSRSQGQTAIVHAGADYVVKPGLLIGMMSQMDWTSQATSALTQNSDGLGWLAGPYMSARLTRNLYFDARAAWGQSVSHIDPLGAFTDTFSTSRVLTSAKLSGDWSWSDFRFKPSAEVIYMAETQKACLSALIRHAR